MKAGISARPFRAKQIIIEHEKTWNTAIIQILQGEDEIGRYERSYFAFGENTFEPFELNGKWYALYAPDYTGTRIMSLPDCKDIGGEEQNACGFCPVELWVPRFKTIKSTNKKSGEVREHWWFESDAEQPVSAKLVNIGFEESSGPWRSLNVGFVAGCLWGDDSTWKLQTFDLSRAAEGVIERSERFGYLELGTMPLTEAIRLEHWPPYFELRAYITSRQTRDVATGALVDPFE